MISIIIVLYTDVMQLALHLIASHLVSQATHVVVVDACGTFAAETLRDIIVAKLADVANPSNFQHAGYMYQPPQGRSAADEALVDQATDMLDRVRLARIFDVTGLVEMIGEVRRACQAAQSLSRPGDASVVMGTGGDAAAEHKGLMPTGPADSLAIGLVVVDDFASLLAPLITSNQIEAQAMITSIHRSLGHLVRSHQICAILLNSVVGSGKASHAKPAQSGSRASDGVSVLQSVSGKPALGQTLAALVDVSIMLSKIPKSRKDAELIYGGAAVDQAAKAAYVEVLEVLKDRYGPRQDRMAAFEIVHPHRLVGYTG